MIDMPLLDGRLLKQLSVPVLSQDEKWQEAMVPLMNEELRILVTRQTALIQEEKQSGHHLIQLKRQKKETLSQLLGLTDQLQKRNEDAENQATRLKALLERINEEIDHQQFRVESIPAEIQKLNTQLLEETVGLGYHKLLADRELILRLNAKIQKLRSELLAMNEEKFALEDGASVIGQYLHSLLGKELSDVLDERYGLDDGEYVL